METPQNVSFSTPVKSMQPNPMSKIRVIVRVRPFLYHEIKAKNGNPIPCVSVPDQDHESGGEVAVYLKDPLSSRNECYKLDAFFSQEDNNVNQIFYTEVCSLIPGIFYGCNATVFAYGATGSGKTYTMEGTVELPGLMPLAMSTVLSMCQRTRSTAEISYYEVYMDKCFDLLEPKEEEIAVWDDKDGRIHLRGLSRVPINSMSEFHEAFSCAIQRRRVGHTDLNDLSSRSHGVLVISVSNPFAGESGTVVTGKLNLIDLAGNEDNRRTCNEGVRLQESAKINQSLFALSNVIYALNNNEPRIPYRESKLTRILQDSLGGTSRALMVACLNPGEYYESVHTVSLAARSRHISNYLPSTQKKETLKVKVDMEAKLRAWLDSKGKTKSSQRMGAFGSSSINRTPCSVSSVKKQDINSKPKLTALQSTSSAKNREISGLHRNLFSNGCQVGSFMEHIPDHPGAEDNDGEKSKAITDASVLESKTPLPDESERVEAVQSSPLRKVLSPIDANVNRKRNPHGVFPFESMTPQTPSALSCESNKYQPISTPLSKFNAMSSNLKNSLAQEYVDFLNAASLEELVEVKGIGLRRAECIIGLRETSPLKSLSDLEKIGLSSKQVQNLFSTGAKGILFI